MNNIYIITVFCVFTFEMSVFRKTILLLLNLNVGLQLTDGIIELISAVF